MTLSVRAIAECCSKNEPTVITTSQRLTIRRRSRSDVYQPVSKVVCSRSLG